MQTRRKRKAMAKPEDSGFLIHFVPGGFYHLRGEILLTGVHKRPASLKMHLKLLLLAKAASQSPYQWVWIK